MISKSSNINEQTGNNKPKNGSDKLNSNNESKLNKKNELLNKNKKDCVESLEDIKLKRDEKRKLKMELMKIKQEEKKKQEKLYKEISFLEKKEVNKNDITNINNNNDEYEHFRLMEIMKNNIDKKNSSLIKLDLQRKLRVHDYNINILYLKENIKMNQKKLEDQMNKLNDYQKLLEEQKTSYKYDETLNFIGQELSQFNRYNPPNNNLPYNNINHNNHLSIQYIPNNNFYFNNPPPPPPPPIQYQFINNGNNVFY